MTVRIYFGAIAVLAFLASVRGQDPTRLPENYGEDIVEAVLDQLRVDNIIPAEYVGFLREIAWVESGFGTFSETYGTGNNGGIWQVSQNAFDATKNVALYPDLVPKISEIQRIFRPNINWLSDVTWMDLRRPLHSAIAAYLYLCTRPGALPQDLAGQASYWLANYDSSSSATVTAAMFISMVGNLPTIEISSVCPENIKLASPDGIYERVSWTPPSNVNINTENSSFRGASVVYVEPGTTVQYRYEYLDAANQPGSCSFLITVSSANGQAIEYCPSNLALRARPGATTRKISWAPPFTLNSVPFTSTNRFPDTTSYFDIGDNLVSYMFRDAQGANPSVCSFIVTVLSGGSDTEQPVLTCPPDDTILVLQEGQTAPYIYQPPTFTDNSGGPVTFEYSQNSGTMFNYGPTVVTATGTDGSGNTNTCSFTVTVSAIASSGDTEAPVLSCPPDQTRSVLAAGQSVAVTYPLPTATDNSGGAAVTFSYSPDSGTMFSSASPPTVVTVTGTDASGNSNTCTFTVTVIVLEGDIFNQVNAPVLCGTRPGLAPQPRIVGGMNPPVGNWPSIGSLRDALNDHYCGATLLSSRWAVTAAHCFLPPNPPILTKVVFGDTNVLTTSATNQESTFTVINNPNYQPDTNIDPSGQNDITLLYLDTPITFNDLVRPMCLATESDELATYHSCYAAGWGYTMEGGAGPVDGELLQTALSLIPNAVCEILDPDHTDRIICAVGTGGQAPVPDTCQGDSGGPLACLSNKDESLHLVGIVSSGAGCGRAGTPGFYTRVSQQIEWINSVVANPPTAP